MNARAMREDLIARASDGSLTPSQAEAEAERLGVGPIATTPDPDDYDPLSETYWTLPMAVSWIAYRRADAVRQCWDVYRESCWTWRKSQYREGEIIRTGWILETRGPANLAYLALGAIVDQVDGAELVMSTSEAQDALWVALRERFFPATGVSSESGRREVIPPLDWQEMVAIQARFGARDEVTDRNLSRGFREVLVPSEPVRRFWAAPKEKRAQLPPLVRPEGLGYMPLSCAAQWIATEGGNRDFDPADEACWREAFDQLLGAIASDQVRVVGTRNGAREPVPGFQFAGIVVDYPFAEASLDLIMSETVYLQSYPYIDEQHWRGGFHDSLVSRHKDHWTHLMVEKSDVRALWPFDTAPPHKSGAPGRPTSAHLYIAEMQRRALAGKLLATLAAEARYLSEWVADNHPDMPQAKPDAVRATIRMRFWELKGKK